jgi:hypothetical protein
MPPLLFQAESIRVDTRRGTALTNSLDRSVTLAKCQHYRQQYKGFKGLFEALARGELLPAALVPLGLAGGQDSGSSRE